jgi:hypothetical protein
MIDHKVTNAQGASSHDERWERVQVGARMEKRMVKVLKGLAEYLDVSMGDLMEGIVLHAFAGKLPFTEITLERIDQLKEVYGLDYSVEASHHHSETSESIVKERDE